MNTIKNFAFDLTTVGSPHSTNNCATFRSLRPHSNLPQNEFSKQDAFNYECQDYQCDRIPFKFSSKISQMKSDTQLNSTLVQEDIFPSENLQVLEQKVIEQLLTLRQEKLTLMEQHNEVIQAKYKAQRELNKAKKKMELLNSSTQLGKSCQYNEILPALESQGSPEIIKSKKNFQPQNQNKSSQEDIETIRKIANIQEAIQQMEEELEGLKNSQQENSHQQTSGQTPRVDVFNQPKTKQETILLKLRTKKDKLLNRIINQTQQQQLRQSLLNLIKSNQELQFIIDLHLYKSKHKLEILRQKIKKEEESKKLFLEDLIEMKSKCKHLKLENEELRKALIYFRY